MFILSRSRLCVAVNLILSKTHLLTSLRMGVAIFSKFKALWMEAGSLGL